MLKHTPPLLGLLRAPLDGQPQAEGGAGLLMDGKVVEPFQYGVGALDKLKPDRKLTRGQIHEAFPDTIQYRKITTHGMMQQPVAGEEPALRLQGIPLPGQYKDLLLHLV